MKIHSATDKLYYSSSLSRWAWAFPSYYNHRCCQRQQIASCHRSNLDVCFWKATLDWGRHSSRSRWPVCKTKKKRKEHKSLPNARSAYVVAERKTLAKGGVSLRPQINCLVRIQTQVEGKLPLSITVVMSIAWRGSRDGVERPRGHGSWGQEWIRGSKKGVGGDYQETEPEGHSTSCLEALRAIDITVQIHLKDFFNAQCEILFSHFSQPSRANYKYFKSLCLVCVELEKQADIFPSLVVL